MLKVADCILAATATIIILCLYLCTLAPTITAADAGELVTAAYELGVAHPPGYPLWCLASHVFIVIFENIEDIACRVNLFSAVCGALTCTLTYVAAREMNLTRMASLAGALLLGASRELWAQSVIAEVYTLNSLLFMSCLLCLLRWDRQRNDRWLLAFSLLLGLGMTNHHTIGIIGPAALAFVLWRNWRTILNWRLMLAAIVLFIVPLSLYLYLPLRSATYPYMDWGHPETLTRLWEHINRSQYKVNSTPLERTAVSMLFQLTKLGRNILDQFSPVVGLAGLVVIPTALARRSDRRWWAMGMLFVGIVIFYEYVINTKFERQSIEADRVFFIPAYCCLAILIAAVLDPVGRFVLNRLSGRVPLGPACAISMAVLLLPAASALQHNLGANDFSDYWYAEDHGRNILATLEKNAVIFPSGDHNTFPLIYLHHVEGMRPDIEIADKYGYVEARSFPRIPVRSRDETRIPKNAVIHYLLTKTDRPVYFTVKWNVPSGLKVQQVLTGLLYRVSRKPPEKDPKEIWTRYKYRNAKSGFDNPPDYGAVNTVSDYCFFKGLSLLKTKMIDEALLLFSRSAALAKGIKEVYNNIGSALAEHGLLGHAQRYYQRALKLDDRYVSALWNLARTSSAVGDRKAAAQYFEKLYEVTPDDFRVPGELGFLYLRHLGNTKQAQTFFDASLKLNPKQPQIQQVLKELGQALAAQEARKGLHVDRQLHDFGKVLIKTKVTTSFELTNTSQMPLDLKEVRADCSCTVPKPSKRHLEPGQSARIDVSYHETKRLGQQRRHVTIKTSAGQKLVLTIRANVVPLFTAEPRILELSELVPNTPQTYKITVLAYDERAFAITSIESTLDEVLPVMTDKLRESATRQTIAVRVQPSTSTGKRTGKLRIHIDDKAKSVVQLPVKMEVRSPVIVRPRSVFLNSLPRKGTKTVTVTLDLPPQWSLNVTSIVPSTEWLAVANPPKQLQDLSRLRITIDTSRVPSSFSGTVTIHTDHPAVPTIIIPVYGFISQ